LSVFWGGPICALLCLDFGFLMNIPGLVNQLFIH
jgi:hypothetical protein